MATWDTVGPSPTAQTDKMTPTTTTQNFTTEDMTLVAVLKLRGLEPIDRERIGNGCRWVYKHCDALDSIVDEYGVGEAYVEPLEFVRKLGLVRTEMYRFLGVKPRRVR